MSLLVCIPFHNSDHNRSERLGYLTKIIDVLTKEYEEEVTIVVDTNSDKELNFNAEIQVHPNLEHPFHLTWMHRQHFKDNIDRYDVFMYLEDDMYLPYKNYLNYLENFKILFPKYIPSFVRIETKRENGISTEYVTDITVKQQLKTVEIGGKQFTNLQQPYHGFWIMPQDALKKTLREDFVRLHTSRETAASYPMWELHKTPMIETEDGQISDKCYSYHLSNNYANAKESPFAKIQPKDIFI